MKKWMQTSSHWLWNPEFHWKSQMWGIRWTHYIEGYHLFSGVIVTPATHIRGSPLSCQTDQWRFGWRKIIHSLFVVMILFFSIWKQYFNDPHFEITKILYGSIQISAIFPTPIFFKWTMIQNYNVPSSSHAFSFFFFNIYILNYWNSIV